MVEMLLEEREAVEAIAHGVLEVHCHPNEWVLHVHQRTGKAFRKVGSR